jgi:hypothetical protein
VLIPVWRANNFSWFCGGIGGRLMFQHQRCGDGDRADSAKSYEQE